MPPAVTSELDRAAARSSPRCQEAQRFRTRWGPEDCLNSRDLGGLRLLSGGHTEFGRVFRAAVGRQAVPEVVRILARTIGSPVHFVDLRSPREVLDSVTTTCSHPDVVVHRFPLHDPQFSDVAHHLRTPSAFSRHYGALIRPAVPAVAAVAELAAGGHIPVVIGCRLGKDRTGVVTILLLHLAGVRLADIANDFALTARAFRRFPTQVAALATVHGEPPAEVMRRCELPASVARHLLLRLSQIPGGRAAAWELLGVNRVVAEAARSSLKIE
ncbi:MAG: tyrosine-protein phosphatase [Pseudonocardiaceae bacterium]